MKILVTGTAGFIGAAVARSLLDRGDEVVGVDEVNDYYDVGLKRARLARIESESGYKHFAFDLADTQRTLALFKAERPDRVVHLAAQAGVRFSIDHPHAYESANLAAFLNVLDPFLIAPRPVTLPLRPRASPSPEPFRLWASIKTHMA